MIENSEYGINKYPVDKYPEQELTRKIIGICMEVHRQLGHGFLEVVYQEALSHELSLKGVTFEKKKDIQLHIEKLYCLTFMLQILLLKVG